MEYIILFLFGSAIGSFLNVVIYRLEESEKIEADRRGYQFIEADTRGKPHYRSSTSIVGGRSYCPHCKHQIRWFDNIPLLSFFILAGRCRDCKEKISWQYPLVEAATGALFFAIYFLVSELRITNYELWNQCYGFDFLNVSCFMFHVSLIYLLIIFSGLFAILVYDFKHYIIPNKIIYPLIIFVLGFNLLNLFVIRNSYFVILNSWQGILLSFTIPLFFLSLIMVSRGRWMGMGDAKLALFMALFLGWPNVLIAAFSAFWLGALVGLPLVVFGRKKMQSQIPFGPFLIVGTFIAFFWGERIISWYLTISY